MIDPNDFKIENDVCHNCGRPRDHKGDATVPNYPNFPCGKFVEAPINIEIGDIVFLRGMSGMGLITAKVFGYQGGDGQETSYHGTVLNSSIVLSPFPGIPVEVLFTQVMVLDVLKAVKK